MKGTAGAPARIREVLHGGSMNLCTENGIDLAIDQRFADVGDLNFNAGEDPFEEIERFIGGLLDKNAHILSLGGDHAVTYPIIRAYAKKYSGLNVLHLDAHPDLYDEYEGDCLSHACPFARIMEEGLVKRLVQIGIRTMNPHQREQAEHFETEIIEMKDWRPDAMPDLEEPLYLSVDLDILDPAFAPGVSHHEPGGMSTRDVLGIIQKIQVQVVGADIVELNPERDTSGITAAAAAKILKETAGRMIETNR
jgi:agmatinase